MAPWSARCSILEGAAYSALSRHYLVDMTTSPATPATGPPTAGSSSSPTSHRPADRRCVGVSRPALQTLRGAVYNLDISPDASLVVVSNDAISRVEIGMSRRRAS